MMVGRVIKSVCPQAALQIARSVNKLKLAAALQFDLNWVFMEGALPSVIL